MWNSEFRIYEQLDVKKWSDIKDHNLLVGSHFYFDFSSDYKELYYHEKNNKGKLLCDLDSNENLLIGREGHKEELKTEKEAGKHDRKISIKDQLDQSEATKLSCVVTSQPQFTV